MQSQTSQRRAGLGSIGYAVIALLCAGTAAFLLSRILQDQGYKKAETMKVVVALHDIEATSVIRESDVAYREIPAGTAPDAAVTSLERLFSSDGQPPVASTGIVKGEVIVEARLADSRRGTGMAVKLRPGYRAMSIKVDDAVARSRLVHPGSHVDLVGSVRDPLTRVSFSRLLVENVRVLSLEEHTDVETYRREERDERQTVQRDTVVTIEVTPDQAEVVALASREGKLELITRSSQDDLPVETAGATTADLLNKKAVAPDQPAEPRRETRRAARRGGVSARRGETPAAEPVPTGASRPAIEVVRTGDGRRR